MVALFNALGVPWWITGFIWNGVYRGLAWVVAVMLPPMAIFFPIFTILEDLGYLPRVAFNLDFLFKKSGAHGKQSLSMAMGFGCNAAGVISTRVIDSPRERLIAILTNNFVPCNGRFPTLIMLATVFVAATFPPAMASFAAASSAFAQIAPAPQSKINNLKSKIVEPLRERELEVLRLLRSELSGPEIARQLIVSLNTLRTHTKSIFNKLGVNNRRAAIRRAEELDLF